MASWVTTTLPSGSYTKMAYGAGLYVIFQLDNSSNFVTSADGITWTQHTSLPVACGWHTVVYDNTAGSIGNRGFIAVGSQGASHYIVTSQDGLTWTSRTSPGTVTWYGLAFGNETWVMTSLSSNQAATSTDAGATWTLRTLPSSDNWVDVAYGNGVFLTCSYYSIATSPDGITWTAHATTSDFESVAFGNGIFVLAANGPSTRMLVTANGTTLTYNTIPSYTSCDITYGLGTFFVLPSTGTGCFTTVDGATCISNPLPSPSSATWQALGFGNNVFIATAFATTLEAVYGNPNASGFVQSIPKKPTLRLIGYNGVSQVINLVAKKSILSIAGSYAAPSVSVISMTAKKATLSAQGAVGVTGVVTLHSKKSSLSVTGLSSPPIVASLSLSARKPALSIIAAPLFYGVITAQAKNATVAATGTYIPVNPGVISLHAKKATGQVIALTDQINSVLAVTANKPSLDITGSFGAQRFYSALRIKRNVINLPAYTSKQFLAGFLRLLPSGRMWNKDSTSNLTQALEPQLGTYARNYAEGLQPSTYLDNNGAAAMMGSANRAVDVLKDTMPCFNIMGADAVTELLPEWQATLGLPDQCLSDTASTQELVAQVVGRFVGLGGQSIQYYTDYASNLGYDIAITEYSPFLVDSNGADNALADENCAFTWLVTSADTGEWLFQTDNNAADEPLGMFGNPQLECELSRIKPAHTNLWFNIDNSAVTVTSPPGFTPDQFWFSDMFVQPNTVVTSEIVILIDFVVPVAISIDQGGQLSVNGDAWSSSDTVNPGDTLQLQATSAATFNTFTTFNIVAGTTAATWNVNTVPA